MTQRGGLFVTGEFIAHSGDMLSFKIDCDALSNSDLDTLAREIARRFRFSAVYGVPRGGSRLAAALRRYMCPDATRLLIVDDVLTTGASMEAARRLWCKQDAIGVVIFARGPCPDWVTPLFTMIPGPAPNAKPLQYFSTRLATQAASAKLLAQVREPSEAIMIQMFKSQCHPSLCDFPNCIGRYDKAGSATCWGNQYTRVKASLRALADKLTEEK